MNDEIRGAILGGDITANPDGEITVDGIPQSKLLGTMVGYTIQMCKVPVNEFIEKCKEAGLPEEFIPTEPRHDDAFARAVRSVEEHTYKNVREVGECRVEYKVDKPHKNEWWTLSERVFGKKDGSTKFGNVVRQRTLFNIKLTDTMDINVEPYSDEINEPELQAELLDRIQKEYITWLGHFHGDYIRRAIRKAITDSRGISYTVANGGTFFVPIKALGLMQKWEAVIQWLRDGDYGVVLKRFNGAGSRFVIKAVLDTQKERLYVLEDVQGELAMRYRDWLKDLLYQINNKSDEDLIAKLVEKKIAQKGEMTQDIMGEYKALLGKEITFELHQDVVDDIRGFTLKDGKKPSARLQGLFDQLLTV